ncbi:FKBP-type peptidyl-prolyl cis-trans isomerase [Candidatus Woesearchaeota archaeon]|nr:FKBP-type peptidyl-prolyl cis-trans isomerase [Candidatus Woesearchaeota archaeon]
MSDDEIAIDLSKITRFFKRKKKEEDKLEKEREKVEIKIESDKEEVKELKKEEQKIIDKEIKIEKQKMHALEKEKKAISSDDVAIDFQKLKKFFIKYQIPILLVLIILLQVIPNWGFLPWGGIWMRMQTQNLPQLDTSARQSVEMQYKLQIMQSIDQQYPHLPDASKKKLVDDKFNELLEKESKTINAQSREVAEEWKKQFQYSSDGAQYVYMPDIDPYQYLRLARNMIEKGHGYDELKDDIPWNNHKVAPLGRPYAFQFHSLVLAGIYTVMNFFNSNVDLMHAATYFPIILIFLSLIPAFFIGRRFAGNVGGFFTASMVALCTASFGRTPWGHADTDAYNVFFPLLILWIFIGAFSVKDTKKKYGLLMFSGLLIGIYSAAWSGWWYVFYAVLGGMGAYMLYLLVAHRKTIAKNFVNIFKINAIKNTVISGVIFFISSAFFVSLISSFNKFIIAFSRPIKYSAIKEAARATLWPNVYTTVAELNPASLKSVIGSVGGPFLFAIAVLGVILMLLKKDESGKYDVKYSALLVVWFIGTMYASTKGVRFTLLLAPAFSVAFGVALGRIYQKVTNWFDKELNMSKIITGTVLIVLFSILLIAPAKADFKRAKADMPLVNDAWWNSLTKIKEESKSDAIINSWWDFGHHFKYIADRAVTFDGGSQNTPMAHWIGHTLLTDNEKEAIGILRMLDCGSNTAFERLLEETGDTIDSVNLLYKIIVLDKIAAAGELEAAGIKNIDEVLKYTHCEPPENYFITSGDMFNKAGVWGHFGSWNFEKAYIWMNLRKLPKDEMIKIMQEKFNYSDEKAEQVYYKVQSIDTEKEANTWISPWPGYTSRLQNCKTQNNEIICNNGLIVNLDDLSAKIKVSGGEGVPESLVYIDENGEFQEKIFANSKIPVSAVLVLSKNGYQSLLCDPLHAKGMFTRLFFMDGHGLKHFELFDEQQQPTGEMIYVWKINWDGGEPRTHRALIKKTTVSQGDNVEVNYIGWLENGTVFDSSIAGWKNKNITQYSSFDAFETKPLKFKSLSNQMIMGFDAAVVNMNINETKTVKIAPEDAYGIDPDAHPMGNKTLNFKIRVEKIS